MPKSGTGDEISWFEPPPDPLGRIVWFENSGAPDQSWVRHDILRRKRGMYDMFIARDMDGVRGHTREQRKLRWSVLAGTGAHGPSGSGLPDRTAKRK